MNKLIKVFAASLEVFLGMVVLGLFLAGWVFRDTSSVEASSALSASSSSVGVSSPLAVQGTPLVVTVKGSLGPGDPTFTGRRHSRSGIPGDTNCFVQGNDGTRVYDEIIFRNTSSMPQQVNVGFITGCGNNTYMAAYSPQFAPPNVCTNYLAGAGRSGTVNWDVVVCANSQFSIVIYELEPGIGCSSYTLNVFGENIDLVSQTGEGPPTIGGPSNQENRFAAADSRTKKRKKKNPGRMDNDHKIIPSPLRVSPGNLLAQEGTPIAAIIADSISNTDPTFTAQRHFRSGLPGDTVCETFGVIGPRFFDEVLFINTSSESQRVSVDFRTPCLGANDQTYAVAYSPQFNPTDICANFIAGAGVSGPVVWEFTVCANSQFSIVVYGLNPGNTCGEYSYTVTGNGIAVKSNDISVLKTGPEGSVNPGSTVAFTITVANNGPHGVGSILLSDPLPPGTTFAALNLLSNHGTIIPAPICQTPPVNTNGTITCSIPLLGPPDIGQPGTPLPNSFTFALLVNLLPGAPSMLTNTATVSFPGMDTDPSNNTSSATVQVAGDFDLCLQDDTSGSSLRLNTTTGQYGFTDCESGVVAQGQASITRRGCLIIFQHNSPQGRVTATVDTCSLRGTASVQDFSAKRTFTISDRLISDNSCSCPANK